MTTSSHRPDTALEAKLRHALGGPLPAPSPFLAARIKAFSRLPQQTAWSWQAASLPPFFTGWMRGAAAFTVTASLLAGVWAGAINAPLTAPAALPRAAITTTTDEADLPGLSSTPFSSLEEIY